VTSEKIEIRETPSTQAHLQVLSGISSPVTTEHKRPADAFSRAYMAGKAGHAVRLEKQPGGNWMLTVEPKA